MTVHIYVNSTREIYNPLWLVGDLSHSLTTVGNILLMFVYRSMSSLINIYIYINLYFLELLYESVVIKT